MEQVETKGNKVSGTWKMVKLNEVCEIVGGTTPSTTAPKYWEGEIPWLSPVDLPEVGSISYVSDSQRKITPVALKECGLTLLPINSVVFSTRASIGKIGVVNKQLCTNQGFTNLIPGNEILPKFLAYTLKYFLPEIEKLGNSTTFKEVSRTSIRNFQIPLPPLPIQKHIAEILDAADALRRKDQELLKKYDDLAQAIFIDMFGDPVRNEKGWEVKKLNEVCDKITDGTHDTPERLTEGIKFITGKHIRPFIIDFENSDYVTPEVHKEIFKRCNPQYGDILYTNIGVNYATAAMNTVNFEFSMKNVALLKYNRDILKGRFLEYQLNNVYFKDKLKKLTGIGGAQQFLSLAQIKSISILTPDIDLQEKFENLIDSMHFSLSKHVSVVRLSEMLFQHLIQKAFTGELVA
jgi:type I restriction enzyme S subunit